MFEHTQGPPYFPSSTPVKCYLIDFQQFRLVNPLSLSCLAYFVDVDTVSAKRWMNEEGAEGREKEK